MSFHELPAASCSDFTLRATGNYSIPAYFLTHHDANRLRRTARAAIAVGEDIYVPRDCYNRGV
jgi:hypothetical protein